MSHVQKKAHFFESYSQKSSILWVKFIKWRFTSLSHTQEGSILSSHIGKGFNSLRHIFFKKKFKFLTSHSKKKGSILCVIFKEKRVQFSASFLKKVQFCETCKKQRKNQFSEWYSRKKGPILSVLFKKNSILGVTMNKIKSLSQIEKGSILSVKLKKAGPILPVMWKTILTVLTIFQPKFQFLSHIQKKVRFFESSSERVQFFASYSKKGFNSLRHIQKKKVQFFELYSKKVQLYESFKEFNTLFFNLFSKTFFESDSKKGSILWVKLKKKKGFNSLSHIGTQEKLNSWSLTVKRLQLFESYWEEVQKNSILWVIYKEFNSVSHFSKKISIFWVAFFDTRFNSLNHISEKRSSIL